MKAQETGMIFTILAKKEEDMVVAHCLELDIVATGNTVKEVKKEMEDLILTQVDYAFSNDNLDNLYHPAPTESIAKNQVLGRITIPACSIVKIKELS